MMNKVITTNMILKMSLLLKRSQISCSQMYEHNVEHVYVPKAPM